VSRVLHLTQHIIGHFRDESFHAITRTGTNNQKPNTQNKPLTVTLYTINRHKKTQKTKNHSRGIYIKNWVTQREQVHPAWTVVGALSWYPI